MTFWAAKCQVDVKKGMGGSGGGAGLSGEKVNMSMTP